MTYTNVDGIVNLSVCNRSAPNSILVGFWSSECYSNAAVTYQNRSFCDLASDENIRMHCNAALLKDAGKCGYIDEPFMKDLCRECVTTGECMYPMWD